MKQEYTEKWFNVSTESLIAQIQLDFHPNLLKNVVSVMDLFDVVYTKHGKSDPQLARAYLLVSDFSYRIPLHILREEQIVFPLLLEIESGTAIVAKTLLRAMENEHHEDLAMIEELKKLTNHFQAPKNSCKSWKKLYQDLERLFEDLQLHIAVEDEILFPRFQEKKGLKIAP